MTTVFKKSKVIFDKYLGKKRLSHNVIHYMVVYNIHNKNRLLYEHIEGNKNVDTIFLIYWNWFNFEFVLVLQL